MSNVDVFSNFLHLLIQGPNSFKKLKSCKSNEKISKILVQTVTSQQTESSGAPAMNGNNGTTPRKEHPEEQEVMC